MCTFHNRNLCRATSSHRIGSQRRHCRATSEKLGPWGITVRLQATRIILIWRIDRAPLSQSGRPASIPSVVVWHYGRWRARPSRGLKRRPNDPADARAITVDLGRRYAHCAGPFPHCPLLCTHLSYHQQVIFAAPPGPLPGISETSNPLLEIQSIITT